MTFHSLLKPFKWPYPIIFNLPESLLSLLASPIPMIFGFYITSLFINLTIYLIYINIFLIYRF